MHTRWHERQAVPVRTLVRAGPGNVGVSPLPQLEPRGLHRGHAARLAARRRAVVAVQEVEQQAVARGTLVLQQPTLHPDVGEARSPQRPRRRPVGLCTAGRDCVQTQPTVCRRRQGPRQQGVERATKDPAASPLRQQPVAQHPGAGQRRDLEAEQVHPTEQPVVDVYDCPGQRHAVGGSAALLDQPRQVVHGGGDGRGEALDQLVVALGQLRAVPLTERTKKHPRPGERRRLEPPAPRLHRLVPSQDSRPHLLQPVTPGSWPAPPGRGAHVETAPPGHPPRREVAHEGMPQHRLDSVLEGVVADGPYGGRSQPATPRAGVRRVGQLDQPSPGDPQRAEPGEPAGARLYHPGAPLAGLVLRRRTLQELPRLARPVRARHPGPAHHVGVLAQLHDGGYVVLARRPQAHPVAVQAPLPGQQGPHVVDRGQLRHAPQPTGRRELRQRGFGRGTLGAGPPVSLGGCAPPAGASVPASRPESGVRACPRSSRSSCVPVKAG